MVKAQQSAELPWVRTDLEGQIEGLSRTASELFGTSLARGKNLFLFFPVHSREMAFDMDVALTGWPSRRIATLESLDCQRLAVRYMVSSRVGPDGVSVYWFFDVVGIAEPQLFQ
jgi:hypothetical protein